MTSTTQKSKYGVLATSTTQQFQHGVLGVLATSPTQNYQHGVPATSTTQESTTYTSLTCHSISTVEPPNVRTGLCYANGSETDQPTNRDHILVLAPGREHPKGCGSKIQQRHLLYGRRRCGSFDVVYQTELASHAAHTGSHLVTMTTMCATS